jgi:vacuolar-type H+-ATPase subunit F/Vma7
VSAVSRSDAREHMARIAAIGEHERVRGFAFAGVHVVGAEDPDAARGAWRALPADVGLVILTPAAQAALEAELLERNGRLWAVIPA